MYNTITAKVLTEAGFTVDAGYFNFLDEASKVQVADAAMTEMFKFITDKYNAIDFSEIEKSAGDYKKFKYRQLVDENIKILRNIYDTSTESGAEAYRSTLNDIVTLENFLDTHREQFTFLYRSKDGMIQILYTSLVSSIVYAVSALVANTIRFITIEDDNDLQLIYDETNNAAKNIHIKNIRSAVASMKAFEEYISTAYKTKRNSRGTVNEDVGLSAVLALAAALIVIVPRIIPCIRQIIYSIYHCRVTVAQAIEVQLELVRTNIESLETTGRSNKKVIARQKNIARKLEKLMNLVAVRMDDAEAMTNRRIAEENKQLHIDRSSPMATQDASALLI